MLRSWEKGSILTSEQVNSLSLRNIIITELKITQK